MTNICYSRDDENFRFIELGDLIDDMRADFSDAELVGMMYWSAPFESVIADDFDISSDILDDLQCRFDDEVGVEEDLFTGCDDDAKKALSELIVKWVSDHIKVGRFYRITGKVTEHTITQDDLE